MEKKAGRREGGRRFIESGNRRGAAIVEGVCPGGEGREPPPKKCKQKRHGCRMHRENNVNESIQFVLQKKKRGKAKEKF